MSFGTLNSGSPVMKKKVSCIPFYPEQCQNGHEGAGATVDIMYGGGSCAA